MASLAGTRTARAPRFRPGLLPSLLVLALLPLLIGLGGWQLQRADGDVGAVEAGEHEEGGAVHPGGEGQAIAKAAPPPSVYAVSIESVSRARRSPSIFNRSTITCSVVWSRSEAGSASSS